MTGQALYPEYKPSGVQWLGELPAHWRHAQVRRVSAVVNGGTPPPDALNWGGEIPWATPVDLNTADGSLLHSTLRTITAQGLASGSSLVPAGSVILSTRAPIGYSVLSGSPVAFNQGCKALVPTLAVDPQFLLLVMQAAKTELSRRGQGTTFLELSSMALGSAEIPLVPISEQREIVSHLIRETAEIDAFIADQEELIGLLIERRGATITYAVTKGLDPSASMKDSGVEWIGTVPEAWGIQPLWSLFARTKDVGHPHEHMLSVFREHGVVRKQDFDNINKTAENRNIYQLVHPGWLVANRMKAWQGSVGVSTHRGIVSGHYLCFSPRHHESAEFLNYLFRSRAYAAGYSTLSRGVRIGQAEIDNDQYRLLPVLIPPRAEQSAIVDYLDRATAELDATIADAREAIALSKERRAALISAAVTGKIDVRELA